MNISQVGINLIKSFEGCRLDAYDDLQPSVKITSKSQLRGKLTIGYGHTGDVKVGQTLTTKQAEDLLIKDLKRYVDGVNNCLKVKVNQYQFDALVSFAYNCGVGALQKSDLLKYINAKKFELAAKEFERWIHAGGKVLAGLVRRRKAERDLFERPISVEKKESKPNTTTKTYIIKKGDTFWDLEAKNKWPHGTLQKLNPTLDPRKLQIGQSINVPK